MKFAQRIAVALALISCAGLAQASNLSLGNSAGASTLLAYGDIASTPNPVTFGTSDNWFFNIASAFGIKTALALYAGGNNLTASLYQCLDGMPCTILGLKIDSVTAGNSMYDSLVNGFYEVSVTSSVTTPQTYSMYVQNVPLPAAMWLLLSGLVGLAATARRRKPSLNPSLV